MNTKYIYGQPPLELLSTPPGAVQFSPLIPGAQILEDCLPESLDSFIIHAPANTIERRYTLALALRALRPNASFTVLAAKDKGGSRLKKELENFGCQVSEDSRRHFRICECVRPLNTNGLDQALIEGAPQLLENTGFWSQPGVFSWDRLDPGSQLLTQSIPTFSGNGADLGCGIGYLSKAVLMSPNVHQLALLDIDRRAITSAKRNITDSRASFLWSDIDNFNASELDFAITNPPFHDTGIQNHGLGQKFIACAHKSLREGGALWLVANRHLPYEDELRKLYKIVTLKADADGYKIYEAIK